MVKAKYNIITNTNEINSALSSSGRSIRGIQVKKMNNRMKNNSVESLFYVAYKLFFQLRASLDIPKGRFCIAQNK